MDERPNHGHDNNAMADNGPSSRVGGPFPAGTRTVPAGTGTIPTGDCVASHPGYFGDYMRLARKEAGVRLEVAASVAGIAPSLLRSLELIAEDVPVRLPRTALLALASMYGVPADEMLSIAGGVPCRLPEPEDFFGHGRPEACVCGWPLAHHAATDLTNALRVAVALQWHAPCADPPEASARRREYRLRLVASCPDEHAARFELSERERVEGMLPFVHITVEAQDPAVASLLVRR